MTSREIAEKYKGSFDFANRDDRDEQGERLAADIDAAIASRDKVIALAVELARMIQFDSPDIVVHGVEWNKARELLAATEACGVKP